MKDPGRHMTVVEKLEAERAFTAFVAEIEPRLRIALMAAYGPDRGRDAAAEALAYAWEHWNRISTMEHPVGYLYRVGQSKSRKFRSGRLQPASTPNPRGDPPLVEPGLGKALEHLSRRQRMAVVLVHGYGWTHDEAASVMGVKTPTVKTHVQRGLTKLRTALEVAGDD